MFYKTVSGETADCFQRYVMPAGWFADMVHPIFAGARASIEKPVLDAYAAYVAQITE